MTNGLFVGPRGEMSDTLHNTPALIFKVLTRIWYTGCSGLSSIDHFWSYRAMSWWRDGALTSTVNQTSSIPEAWETGQVRCSWLCYAPGWSGVPGYVMLQAGQVFLAVMLWAGQMFLVMLCFGLVSEKPRPPQHLTQPSGTSSGRCQFGVYELKSRHWISVHPLITILKHLISLLMICRIFVITS